MNEKVQSREKACYENFSTVIEEQFSFFFVWHKPSVLKQDARGKREREGEGESERIFLLTFTWARHRWATDCIFNSFIGLLVSSKSPQILI